MICKSTLSCFLVAFYVLYSARATDVDEANTIIRTSSSGRAFAIMQVPSEKKPGFWEADLQVFRLLGNGKSNLLWKLKLDYSFNYWVSDDGASVIIMRPIWSLNLKEDSKALEVYRNGNLLKVQTIGSLVGDMTKLSNQSGTVNWLSENQPYIAVLSNELRLKTIENVEIRIGFETGRLLRAGQF